MAKVVHFGPDEPEDGANGDTRGQIAKHRPQTKARCNGDGDNGGG